MKDVYVLGGGISGLVAAYLLDVPVITDHVGGQNSAQSFPLGPRYIHSVPETRELLGSLGLDTDERMIEVGYFYEGSYHKALRADLVAEYNLKTRGMIDVSSNVGEGPFKALKTSFPELIKKLSERTEVIIDTIYEIRRSELLGEKGTYGFSKLISTIPLPRLYSLFGKPSSRWRYVSVMYCLSRWVEPPHPVEAFDDFDYVYFPEREYPYYRVTKTEEGFVYEYALLQGVPTDAGDITAWGDNTIIQRYGKILPPYRLPPPAKNVYLLGRYGEWDDDVLLQDVVRRCIGLREVIAA
jgi:hypothetical protein